MLVIVITLCSLAISIVGFFLAAQILLGLTREKTTSDGISPSDGSLKILIPAHNESAVILRTLESLEEQGMSAQDILVVADNCSDDTADIVRSYGATVTERHNLDKRGKGFALAHGIEILKSDPPDYVVIVDADCTLENGAIEQLFARAHERRVVQSRYQIKAPSNSDVNLRLAEFFFLIKNHIRPLGLSRLGSSITLTGSGMLFPWEVISGLNIATGEIAEDTKFGLDAQLSGLSVIYAPQSKFVSYFPSKDAVRDQQSQRWEQGNLQIAADYVPKLMAKAFRSGDFRLLASAMNLVTPPTTMLLIALGLTSLLSLLSGFLSGSWLAFNLAFLSLITVCVSVFICWLTFGRNILSSQDLILLPVYILKKFPRYLRLITNRQREWVKTDRD